MGLYLQTTGGHRVCLTAPGKQGDVDASDGALAVLCGRRTDLIAPFGEFEDSKCFVPAGAIEYELAIAEADPPAPEHQLKMQVAGGAAEPEPEDSFSALLSQLEVRQLSLIHI